MSKYRVINGGKTAPRPILMATYSIMVPSNLSREMQDAYEILKQAHVPGTETEGKWWETCFMFGVKALTNAALETLQPKNPCGVPGHPVTAFVIEEHPSEANGQQGTGYCAICRDLAEQGGPTFVFGENSPVDPILQAELDSDTPPPPIHGDDCETPP